MMVVTPETILVRLVQVVLVPQFNPDVIWSIAPLLFGLVMMQMYFGKYKTEELGWNTAFGNSVSLMWVVAILGRYLYVEYGYQQAMNTPGLQGQMLLVGILAVLTVWLIVINYKHALPKNVAFMLGSSLPTSIFAYLAIVIVMGRVPVDLNTLIAGVLFSCGAWLVFFTYRHAITSPWYVEKTLERRKKERKKAIRKATRKIEKKVGKVLGEKK